MVLANENSSGEIGTIRVRRLNNADTRIVMTDSWSKSIKIPFTEYSIKESDYRIKTASFTSPVFFDLTTGRHLVKIGSLYHENFAGIMLDVEYDEKTGLYTYQCQDWSRGLISKLEMVRTGTVHTMLRWLIGKSSIPYGKQWKKLTAYEKKILSGLRKVERYNQSYYPGNKYKGNPFNQKRQMIIRDKSYIEVIRDLVFNSLGYFDVWFNDKGVLQIEPLSKTDWENTGLHLSANEYTNRKFKFSTTNAITGVLVNGSDKKIGDAYGATELVNLKLAAFFGAISTSISNPNNNTKAATNSSSKSTTSSTATVGKNGNPFNTKAKRIIVSADGGSGGFKNNIVKLLKKDGWSVTDLGVGPGTHSSAYNKLSSKYAVNLTIYNGPDPKTIDEPVTGWLKGRHEKYGVRLVQMFDSSSWTSKTGKYNKKGMWYKRHGDFKGYRLPKAWDDNYSGARSGVLINDLEAWYIKYHKKVCYCCGTTPSEAYKQFKAGGYLMMKGKVK